MRFRDFIRDPAEAAAAMIENPGQLWRRGFAKASQEDELAAVLHYASKGFPADGKSLTIQAPGPTNAVRSELMRVAEEMATRGKLALERNAFGYVYIGEPSHVARASRITMRRKPEMLLDDEEHREMGRLLGYDEDAIDEFLSRFKGPKPLD